VGNDSKSEIMKNITLLALILVLMQNSAFRSDAQVKINIEQAFFKSETLFDPLNDGMGYHNYRIPSLLVTQKGTILAVMEGREDRNHDHAKNDIVLKRSTDNGVSWSVPTVIQEAGDNVVMNPVMVQAQDGTILLVYIYFPEKLHTNKRSHGVKQVDAGLKGSTVEKVFVIKSTDEGQSWSKPMEITSIAKSNNNSLYAIAGPGVGITLTRGEHKGRVIIPMSETLLTEGKKEARNYALYSDDNGKTWVHGQICPASAEGNFGGNEVQMVELEGGKVMVSIRSKGHRLVSTSNDGGTTWAPLKRHNELPDTGCMSPLLRYKWADDNTPGVLVHIGVTGRPDGRKRGQAIIALSYDDGITWPVQRPLYNKNFDYSSLAILDDGTIGMLAEYDFDGQRAQIKFANFNRSWIESQSKQLQVRKVITQPKHTFITHPKHQVPAGMVLQNYTVELEAIVEGHDDFTIQYELIESQGDVELLKTKNVGKYSSSTQNSFVADWYGPNVIKVTARDKKGKLIASILDTTFVHFAHTQLAGGDITKLNKKYKGKEFITGKIENGQLKYSGMRFLPSDISKGDVRYEGTQFGAYETKEPRVLVLSDGTLIASYHFQVKGVNDAPPGLTLVMTRSTDGGKTWVDDQILLQDINGVVAYTSMVEWNNEVHCYFAGGHASHQHADAFKGVYRTVSTDKGKTWSKAEPMPAMTKLVHSGDKPISPSQSPNTNALFIPDMVWKGEKGDAYLVPFYVSPIHILITMDGGQSWDVFYDEADHPEMAGAINELSWALLNDRSIYMVSRRQSKKGYKNEILFDLSGKPTLLGQSRRNHKARRCHQGAVTITSGEYKGRVAVASNYSGDREEATIAISHTPKAEVFITKFLTYKAAWGYCHIDWMPDVNGFVLIGESEPFDNNEKAVSMDGGPDRNERFSIECFAFSPAFYETLVEADIHK